MNSGFFQLIGLGGLDPAILFFLLLVLIIVLFVLIILQQGKLKKLNEKYESFMGGRSARRLEDAIMELFDDIRFLKDAEYKERKQIARLTARQRSCFQKVGLVKYDAFREMGGMLSFSICLLDQDDNGFILNSVHSNNGCYTYSKEIVNGVSYIELGDEEKEAMEIAMNKKEAVPAEDTKAGASHTSGEHKTIRKARKKRTVDENSVEYGESGPDMAEAAGVHKVKKKTTVRKASAHKDNTGIEGAERLQEAEIPDRENRRVKRKPEDA